MPLELGWKNYYLSYGALELCLGEEVVLPTDIIHDSPRVQAYVENDAEEAMQDSLDLLEEEREIALQRSTIYQQKLRQYHS